MVRRLDLKLGYSCNNNCRFCAVADKRGRRSKNLTDVEGDLRAGRADGADFLVITGGEPTLDPKLVDIITMAHRLGYRDVQLQTNARMLSYRDLVNDLVAAGLTQVVPAVHGHVAALHDHLTKSPGAFDQAIAGLRNVCDAPLTVITNTVVAKPNYAVLPDIARFLIEFGPDSMQFDFVHPMGNAEVEADTIVPVISQAARYVAEALDVTTSAGIPAFYEAIPYCLMPDHKQQAIELHMASCEVREPGRVEREYRRSRREDDKRKGPQCHVCRYNLICEGVWREYAERFGTDELIPVQGTPVSRDTLL